MSCFFRSMTHLHSCILFLVLLPRKRLVVSGHAGGMTASAPATDDDENEQVDYVKIYAMMKAAGCHAMEESPCIGHKLIPMRAMKQLDGDLTKLSTEEKKAKEK